MTVTALGPNLSGKTDTLVCLGTCLDTCAVWTAGKNKKRRESSSSPYHTCDGALGQQVVQPVNGVLRAHAEVGRQVLQQDHLGVL